jgi:hypothetical protein
MALRDGAYYTEEHARHVARSYVDCICSGRKPGWEPHYWGQAEIFLSMAGFSDEEIVQLLDEWEEVLRKFYEERRAIRGLLSCVNRRW